MNKSRVVTDKRVSQLPIWLWSNSNVLPTSYRRIWEAVREERAHAAATQAELLVDTKKVFPLLLTSQLPTEVLGYIWGLANQKYAGKLTEQELYVVLALVAVAQTSYPFTNLQVLHLLPGPPEPRINLSLIYPNATPSVAPQQDALHRSDNPITKNEIQARSAYKSNPVPSGITIPGLVPNNSQMGETKIDSKTQVSSVPVPKVPEANSESSRPLSARLDGKSSGAQSCSSADSNDDFSDFQSAAPIQHVPQSIPMWDSKQGSAIGSRLANHNLGVKKPSDKVKKIPSTSFSNAPKSHGGSRNVFPAPEKAASAQAGSKDALSNAERLGDLFPKCALKSQAKTVILKDTAIRNNDPPKSVRNECSSVASIDKIESPATSTRTIPSKFATATASPRDSGNSAQDLMNLQQVEDKYSALRVLVEEPNTVESSGLVTQPIAATSALSQSDDFGDFVSAEDPIQLPNTSPILGDNTSDPFSDFERLRSSNNGKTPNETPLDLGTISQAFGNLEIEAPSDIYSGDEKKEAIIEAEKIKPKEDTISVNSIELGNGANEVIITRSNSVPSLDLKSFLSPSTEDEQQQMENMHQLIYWEWKQYMESCVLLLQTAANVFGSITSDGVLQEVLVSAQGYNFLCNLAEVAAVCRRVNFSHKEMDINIMGFDDILMDIDRIWAEMEPFYANIPIVTELPVWPLHQSESSACCALCLTVVTSGRIVYNDNNYHVTCANLWLNCVNHNLPTLRYPLSSFLTHPMPIASTGNNQI